MLDIGSIGSVFRSRRKQIGLSQLRVAANSGISVVAMNRIEMGRSQPKFRTIVRIADVLGMKIQLAVTLKTRGSRR